MSLNLLLFRENDFRQFEIKNVSSLTTGVSVRDRGARQVGNYHKSRCLTNAHGGGKC
jgi:hypothetical protein